MIFKPTIKGLVIGLGYLDIKFNQIKNNSEKVTDMSLYKEFEENFGVERLNEFLKISCKALIQYDLINNNLNQVLSDPYSFNKLLLRVSLLQQLTAKDFDIENLFCLPEQFYAQKSKNYVSPKVQEPYKKILVKLRDNLQKTIDLFPE